MFNLIGRKGLSKKSFLAFSLVEESALIINFEGREVKGLSKDRYDETFAGEDGICMLMPLIPDISITRIWIGSVKQILWSKNSYPFYFSYPSI